MAERFICPACGAQLSGVTQDMLCPACLFQLGLHQPRSNAGVEPTMDSPRRHASSFEPPKPEDIAELFPQLEILDLVGHGGMGAVYKARQKNLDRIVALKIIKPTGADDHDFSQRFAREARMLARLNHPHIVGLYEFGQVGDDARHNVAPSKEDHTSASPRLYFFIMEYVDGTNLRQVMQHVGFQPDAALAVVRQTCEALQYAHEEGVVHRDIKPENILIDRRGRVKIADFGLAKLLKNDGVDDPLTHTYQIMGTPRYMAPEQMEGSPNIDHRADIYSLGVVFYELLTGELPLGRFDPPSSKVQVSIELDKVVLRALEKEPQRRYQYAGEMKTDVESITTQPPIRPVSAPRKEYRPPVPPGRQDTAPPGEKDAAPPRLTMNVFIAWVVFLCLGVTTSVFSVHDSNPIVSLSLWLTWAVVTPTLVCGLVVWIGQRRRGMRYPIHPGEWLWQVHGLAIVVWFVLNLPVSIMETLTAMEIISVGRALPTVVLSVLLAVSLVLAVMSLILVLVIREAWWRFYVSIFALASVLRALGFALGIAAMWNEQDSLAIAASSLHGVALVPVIPLAAIVIGDLLADKRYPWSHWVGVGLHFCVHSLWLVYVIRSFL